MLRTFVVSLRLAAFALGTAASVGCASSPGEPDPPPPTPLRLLFVGNSLTYFHQLPELVQQLGASDPSHPVEVTSVAFPDYSLEDHWNRGDALAAIAAGGWDYVLLQQGPSALPESRVLLVDYVTRFAAEIRKVGARPAVYMVWPPLSREAEWSAVTASYTAAAEAVDGLLLPVGEALRAVRRADMSIGLFEKDGFHPSETGSYAAALVIYARAAGVSPVGLTERAGGSTLPAPTVAALETGAAAAIERAGAE
jgi:hypothetical protein